MRSLTDRLHPLAPAAPVVLRVLIGIVMAFHGYQKLTGGPSGFADSMLAGAGVPAPLVFAWIVTIVELVGGIALIVGAFTRLAALAILPILIGALFLVKLEVGLISSAMPGAELDLALIAGLVGILFLGPGPVSVDQAIGVEDPVPGRLAATR